MLNENLMSDVRSKSLNAVNRRLPGGADINAADERGMTPLMQASARNRLKTAAHLLENGADTENVENSVGCNALTFACLSGSFEVVRMLLDHGGNVNARDRFRRTALMAAAASGNIGAALLLLTNGADAQLESKFGTTAADLAAIEGHTEIVALLQPSGASARIWGERRRQVKSA
jgi:ankyrin repeat protein